MTYILTYHQVMPTFLDFLFPFGRQAYQRDFHFSGFRHETRLEPNISQGLQLPQIQRSGRDIRMCYNLKSVEPSNSQPDWPWSIRQTAVYHSFDVQTKTSTWIIVKGSQLMKRRIESATGPGGLRAFRDFSNNSKSLAASLSIHLMIADWCAENWRWYISFLEESLQDKTRRTLAVNVESPQSPVQEKPFLAPTLTISSTQHQKPTFRSRTSSFLQKYSSFASSHKPKIPDHPGIPPGPPSLTNEMALNPTDFQFVDLQRIQLFEDKSNEMLLILELNVNVLSELKEYYQSVTTSEHWPDEPEIECRTDIAHFKNRLTSITKDLEMQQSRTKTLLRVIADRKSLVRDQNSSLLLSS